VTSKSLNCTTLHKALRVNVVFLLLLCSTNRPSRFIKHEHVKLVKRDEREIRTVAAGVTGGFLYLSPIHKHSNTKLSNNQSINQSIYLSRNAIHTGPDIKGGCNLR